MIWNSNLWRMRCWLKELGSLRKNWMISNVYCDTWVQKRKIIMKIENRKKLSRILNRLKLTSARAQSAPRDRVAVFLTWHYFFVYKYNFVKFYKKLPWTLRNNRLDESFQSPEISSTLSSRERRSAQVSEALALLLNIV